MGVEPVFPQRTDQAITEFRRISFGATKRSPAATTHASSWSLKRRCSTGSTSRNKRASPRLSMGCISSFYPPRNPATMHCSSRLRSAIPSESFCSTKRCRRKRSLAQKHQSPASEVLRESRRSTRRIFGPRQAILVPSVKMSWARTLLYPTQSAATFDTRVFTTCTPRG